MLYYNTTLPTPSSEERFGAFLLVKMDTTLSTLLDNSYDFTVGCKICTAKQVKEQLLQ